MIKVRKWELTLIRLVGLPILKKINEAIMEKAQETDTKFDDALAGSFAVVTDFLEDPGTFQIT